MWGSNTNHDTAINQGAPAEELSVPPNVMETLMRDLEIQLGPRRGGRRGCQDLRGVGGDSGGWGLVEVKCTINCSVHCAALSCDCNSDHLIYVQILW